MGSPTDGIERGDG